MKRIRSFRSITTRVVQASLICGFILGALGWIWPPALHLPQLWLVLYVSVLANVFQPSYQLLEGSRTPEDKGDRPPNFMDCVFHADPRHCRDCLPPASLPAAGLDDDYRRNRDCPQARLTDLGSSTSRSLVHLEHHSASWTGSRHRRTLRGYSPSELRGRLVDIRRKLRAPTIIRGSACRIGIAALGVLETHPA
jgi:hypothetical protein